MSRGVCSSLDEAVYICAPPTWVARDIGLSGSIRLSRQTYSVPTNGVIGRRQAGGHKWRKLGEGSLTRSL